MISKQTALLFSTFGVLAATYLGCSHFTNFRAPAGYSYDAPSTPVSEDLMQALRNDAKNFGGTIRFPQGMSSEEAVELWHLSEGSDVYPLRWFMTMPSLFGAGVNGTYLYEKLDQKFGVIREPDYFAARSPFPLKYIGLSTSWSEAHPTEADVRLQANEKMADVIHVKRLPDEKDSIAMVGVNCTFCHSNQVSLNGKTHFVEGAPNMMNIRGFFQDMYASTAKTMLTPDLLEAFLERNKVPGDTKKIANEFSESFRQELGLSGLKKEVLGKVINFIDSEYYNGKKTQTLRKAFFDNRIALENRLIALLKMTYGLEKPSTELRLRMRFLAQSIGLDPNLATTPEGFARTDAFGRIANLVARTKNPIPLTATSSVPSMWNIQYRALFHWNANTNSVVMRNIGQSFGLGALMTNVGALDSSKYDSTTNIHNLHRLEEYLYKLRSPDWVALGGKVNKDLIETGCVTFHKTCAGCHMPKKDRVGPQKALIEYPIIPADRLGTDLTYSRNQSTPVDGQKFKDALFHFTRAVRDRYYERYQVSPEEQAQWEKRDLRGPELFRDTILGESDHTGVSTYMNIPVRPTPGYPARNLAGIWATAPYLHNGSVPNLYELLKPSPTRPKIFFVGNRNYNEERLGYESDFQSLPPIPDLEAKAQELMQKKPGLLQRLKGIKVPRPANILEAKIQVACSVYPERCFIVDNIGNSNQGHEGPIFGTQLADSDKRALIEFLKVLRPEVEYSKNQPPIYSWDGQSCHINQGDLQ